MFFCDFCKFFKALFTESVRVTTSGSSGSCLKAYQNDINWGNNVNTERIFVFCDNLAIQNNLTNLWDFQEKYLWWSYAIAWNYNIVPWL